MKKSKPQASKQLSIASFMFQNKTQGPAPDSTARAQKHDKPTAIKESAPSSEKEQGVQQRPSKRPRTLNGTESAPTRAVNNEGAVEASRSYQDMNAGSQHVSSIAEEVRVKLSPLKAIPPRSATRHQQFQSKLASDATNRTASEVGGRAGSTKYTPLELQVVDLKRQHPGVLLMVEVGYKMRFFGEDAEIAAKECNIFCYPDHNFMTASIPVPRIHVYTRKLVDAGHKVGVVRQIETAAIKSAGAGRNTVFQRKLTALYTRATLEAGDLELVGSCSDRGHWSDGTWSNAQLSNYLMVVVEGAPKSGVAQGVVELGVVAVETSTGDVVFDKFRDGIMREQLESRLMYTAPAEIIVATPVSSPTEKLLGSYSTRAAGMRVERAQGEQYSAGGAVDTVKSFYGSADSDDERGAGEAIGQLPPLVIQALAHALDYLKPFGVAEVLKLGATFRRFSADNEMSLSPNALSQLEVLRNSDDGSERGSLLWLMDHTKTAFGGRLMRYWVTHPLRKLPLILERQQAVTELLEAGRAGAEAMSPVLRALPAVLSALPDLQRGITRIFHATASPSELLTIMKALATLRHNLHATVHMGCDGSMEADVSDIQSTLLQKLIKDVASPQVSCVAEEMLSGIDEAAATENDKIHLFKSKDRFPEVFSCKDNLQQAEQKLQDLLPHLAGQLGLFGLKYTSIQNQGDYLIEVPVDRAKSVPKDWECICSTKKCNRYHPPAVKQAIHKLEIAQEELQAACVRTWNQFLGSFRAFYIPFRDAVSSLATLDALLSLAVMAANNGYTCPQFVDDAQEPQLMITGGRHPILEALQPGSVVPNDTHLESGAERVMVVTGPNMGGKSLFIRMVALQAIMAQIGCYVCADSCRLHVFDSVHTRMGASDNLEMGRSTFLEELTEASSILSSAGPSSLVIIDELGRGTSTHDGQAIAIATLHYMLKHNKCITMWVTHYPQVATLRHSFPSHIGCYYMAYLKEQQTDDSPTRDVENRDTNAQQPAASGAMEASKAASLRGVPQLTFLYKATPGVADRSFGLSVARMADLPDSLINTAALKAEEMEHNMRLKAARASECMQPSAWTSLAIQETHSPGRTMNHPSANNTVQDVGTDSAATRTRADNNVAANKSVAANNSVAANSNVAANNNVAASSNVAASNSVASVGSVQCVSPGGENEVLVENLREAVRRVAQVLQRDQTAAAHHLLQLQEEVRNMVD